MALWVGETLKARQQGACGLDGQDLPGELLRHVSQRIWCAGRKCISNGKIKIADHAVNPMNAKLRWCCAEPVTCP